MKKQKINIKEEKGFTGIDLTIAIIIIMLFVSLITAIFMNVYYSAANVKRSEVASSYAIAMFEEIERLSYDEVISDTEVAGEDVFLNLLQKKLDDLENGTRRVTLIRRNGNENTIPSNFNTPYLAKIKVEKYQETRENIGYDIIKTITLEISYPVGGNIQKVEMDRLKLYEQEVEDHLGISPTILSNMTPVKYKEDGWYVTTTSDSEWFDYSENKWANVMLNDSLAYDVLTKKVTSMGSMFVYVPRFAYMIPTTSYANDTFTTSINIKFLNTNNTCKDGTNTIINTQVNSAINASNYYIQHPAFTFEEQEVEGLWVAKFIASKEGATMYSAEGEDTIRVIPTISSWRNISLKDAILKCKQMKELSYGTNYYGFTSDIDTHLMKNTEYGAVLYLAYSQFGITDKIASSTESLYYRTGASNISANYDTPQGLLGSSTGNEYGVYDLGAGKSEYVAGINTNVKDTLFYDIDLKHLDIYESSPADTSVENYNYNQYKYGDALYETAKINTLNNTIQNWFGDTSTYTTTAYYAFIRGGNTTTGSAFYFTNSNGTGQSYIGFRPVIVY